MLLRLELDKPKSKKSSSKETLAPEQKSSGKIIIKYNINYINIYSGIADIGKILFRYGLSSLGFMKTDKNWHH